MYGYYAQGVGEETAVLPDGWRDRLADRREQMRTTARSGLADGS